MGPTSMVQSCALLLLFIGHVCHVPPRVSNPVSSDWSPATPMEAGKLSAFQTRHELAFFLLTLYPSTRLCAKSVHGMLVDVIRCVNNIIFKEIQY